MGDESGSAEALASFIKDDLDNLGGTILFPKGNLAKETLVNILELNDISVDQVVAYETVPNQQLENLLGEEDLPDWMVFFSPSGASYSLPILDRFHQENLSQVRLVAIGPTTQKEIEKLGYQVYRTAGKPTPGAVRQALVEPE